MERKSTQRGNTLLELLVTVAMAGLLAMVVCESLIRSMRRTALRAAALRLQYIMEGIRHDAYGNTQKRGLRFSRNASGWEYAVYQDTDEDGVLNADILSGVDILVEGPFPLVDRLSIATIGVPAPQVKHPDTGAPFSASAKPVNFNQSSICSFSPNGDATPGTIYLVNGNPREAAMVRSSGEGGRVRALFYGLGGKGWTQ